MTVSTIVSVTVTYSVSFTGTYLIVEQLTKSNNMRKSIRFIHKNKTKPPVMKTSYNFSLLYLF